MSLKKVSSIIIMIILKSMSPMINKPIKILSKTNNNIKFTKSIKKGIKTMTSKQSIVCLSSDNNSDPLKALNWECKHGYSDYKGRTSTFSRFMSHYIKNLRTNEILEREQNMLIKVYIHYASFNLEERKKIISDTKNFISKIENSNISTSNSSELEIEIKEENKSVREIYLDNFNQSAIEEANVENLTNNELKDIKQLSPQWRKIRSRRLTASSFASVLGFFNPEKNIHDLWLEKLGLKDPFKGDKKTFYGSKNEKQALKTYCSVTGYEVSSIGLKLMGEDRAHDWLAASPDGIIHVNLDKIKIKDINENQKENGILEIKCPYGLTPDTVTPWQLIPSYYLPQIQGQMDIFEIEWGNLFCWTKNHGCTIFYVKRNREYWNAVYEMLSDFWWNYVIPGRLALKNGEDVEKYRPVIDMEKIERIKEMSLDIAKQIEPVYISNLDNS